MQVVAPRGATTAVVVAARLAEPGAMHAIARSDSRDFAGSSAALTLESLVPPTREAAILPRHFPRRPVRPRGNPSGSPVAPDASPPADAFLSLAFPVLAAGLALVRSLFVRSVFVQSASARPGFVRPSAAMEPAYAAPLPGDSSPPLAACLPPACPYQRCCSEPARPQARSRRAPAQALPRNRHHISRY